jgi:hypothetical protein
VRILRESPFNSDFGMNNEKQDHKIGSVVGGTCERGRGNGRAEDDRIWLMDFIYKHEIEG